MTKLSDLKKTIAPELAEFDKRFKRSMKSSVPLLEKITYYIVQRKGKQVRPMFVFLSAKVFGPIRDETYIAASLIELLHTASLVHDDVVDDSHKRRGFFSINALWKNKIAVLVGDYLLSTGMLLAVENEQFDSLRIASKAIKQMIEGELLQAEKARGLNFDESIYFDIINQKTASLVAASCSIGASSVGQDAATVERMWQFGTKAGMAFQIKDDLFDYGYKNIGKPTGIDIKEKKLTLPLIHVLKNVDKKERSHIVNLIKKSSEKRSSQRYVIDFVKKNGGIEYAEEKMNQFRDEAFDLLSGMQENEAFFALKSLVDFVVERKS